MLSWDDVRRWNPAEVSVIAARILGAVDAVHEQSAQLLHSIDRLDWSGDAADAAKAALRNLHGDCVARGVELEHIAGIVQATANSMYPLLAVVDDCESLAQASTCRIESDGSVADERPMYMTAADDAWGAGRERLRERRELAARAGMALALAVDLDEHAAAALSRVESEPVAVLPASAPMPPGGSPAANAAFWEAAAPDRRTNLLVNHPESIGNVDGIPAGVRDAANRRRLVLERTRLEGVARELTRRLEANTFGGLTDDADAGLEQTEKRLAALDAIARTLDQGNRQLLVLDNSSSEDTLAAIAVGNVQTATHVAVFVPGLNSDVAGDVERYDGDMDALKKTVDRVLEEGETAACVTWANYQAPQLGWSLLDPRTTVLSTYAAAAGASRLSGFLDGLDAARSQDPHLSLVGHSYGSLTAALALRGADTTGVDDMVSLGSPGIGIDSTETLSIPPGHVFVGEAAGDVVADLGVFGRDPEDLDGVRFLSTSAEGELEASRGHSEYLSDGTTSQHEVALVVAGRVGDVTG